MSSKKEELFKDSRNRLISRALFLELCPPGLEDKILYSLKSEDQEIDVSLYPESREIETRKIPSLYRLYLEESDPLEFNFAQKYFYDYDHWIQICETTWMKPVIERWRRDVEQKIKTEAIQVLREDAKSGSRTAVSSAKFLAQKGWEEKVPRTVREKQYRKKTQEDHLHTRIDEDWERLNGTDGQEAGD